MDSREHIEQHLVNQPGFRRLDLLHPETDGDYLLLAYWESAAAFEQWTTTNDVEAAHDELFGAMLLAPDYVDRYESAAMIEALRRSFNRTPEGGRSALRTTSFGNPPASEPYVRRVYGRF